MTKSIGVKIYVRVIEENCKTSIQFGTQEKLPKWKKQFEDWEDDGNDIDNDFIEEIGTTAEPKKLLNKINKLIEEHYECSTY